jgi:5-amino-6-(5-phosphoribosylamino)uracil reductase
VLSEPARGPSTFVEVLLYPGAIVSDPPPNVELRRLLPATPAGQELASVSRLLDEVAATLSSPERAESAQHPYVLLNMASTADGRASIGGRSGPIGDRADSELLHGLRTLVDALLIGAQTARAERYGRIVRDERERAERRARGLAEEPLTCIVSRSLDLSPESVPLLGEGNARIAILTASSESLPEVAASVEYVRAERDGELDLELALSQLRERHGVDSLLCEGGPSLATELAASGMLGELFLTFAPKLAGGREALRISAGQELQPPAEMRLVSVYEHDSQLFLRYALAP